MACPGRVPSSWGENYPNPKSGWDLDPDKPGCNMSCWGDENEPTFLHAFFWIYIPVSLP